MNPHPRTKPTPGPEAQAPPPEATGSQAAGEEASGPAPPAGQPEFLNRELSWLQFNRRVLAQALDARMPLLERAGFLAIFNSNLDEFFQKRVGGLKRQLDAGVHFRSPDGMTPKAQLKAIREAVMDMLAEQAACYQKEIKPQLAKAGIHLLDWDQLTEAERAYARGYFRENLFPVLTPLAVDPGHPFPFISNLSTSLAVMLRPPLPDAAADDPPKDSPGGSSPSTPEDAPATAPAPRPRTTVGGVDTNNDGRADLQFARVKVPAVLPKWVRINPPDAEGGRGAGGGGGLHKSAPTGVRMVKLDQIICHNLGDLFEGMRIQEVEPFRVTRNADVDRDQEDAEDLLELIEQELRDRRFARGVRLEVDNEPYRPLNRFLVRELNLHPKDVYEMPAELDYTDLWTVYKQDRPELKFEPWTPVVPPRLADRDTSMFSVIRRGDVMVHHPYESFSASVERFIREAARDPRVVAIKQTLYRTSADSPFIPELIRAAEAGKQVVVLVELKARFDEERNVYLAQQLEKAGIHVVYGVMGLKTHTKTSLVVRREPADDAASMGPGSEGGAGRGGDGLGAGDEVMRCYAHIGTGNYNSKTAQLYTDLGLFTCDPRLTRDVVELFHYLTGRSVKRDFQHLLVAPINMRPRFEEMIDREIAHARAWRQRGADPDDPVSGGRPRIIAKMNSLEDKKMARRLYAASAAGVKIDLIVRGFCCLRPGVPGMSENIAVSSVIGRFLEHSRVYCFHNAGRPEYYIGSADWMYRNLNNRVECITPIHDPALQQRLRTILRTMLGDQRQAWDMAPDGQYTQRRPVDKNTPSAKGTHRALMELAWGRETLEPEG